jgi:hypothetical protein
MLAAPPTVAVADAGEVCPALGPAFVDPWKDVQKSTISFSSGMSFFSR